MKVNSLIAKTALAAAIAGASFAASAGVLDVPTPSVVATELFGDAKNSAAESNLTAVTLPVMDFYATTGGELITKNAGVGSATIKLTLLGESLFAENYQDPSLWKDKGIVVEVDGVEINHLDVLSVDAGTANDNTLTITLQPGAVLNASGAGKFGSAATGPNLDAGVQNLQKVIGAVNPAVSIAGFKVKRLKAALEQPGQANVTVEVRAFEDAAKVVLGAGAQAFENTPSTAAIVSTQGVVLAGTSTDYTAAPSSSRGYIQVADAQQSFTDTTVGGHRDVFDASTNAIPKLDLGTLSLQRGVVAASRPAGAGLAAGKETGTLFDFTGADKLKLSITGSAPLAAYGLELRTDACSNAGNATNRLSVGTVSVAEPNVAEFSVNTADTNLDAPTPWYLCGVASVTGTERIPQLNSLKAGFSVEYANIRYGESEGSYEYGAVLRNGCQVTLFNVPNVAAGDKAMIRLTNTSDKAGQVNAYAYLEDGRLIDEDVQLIDNLPAHGTTVFHTNANLANGVFLGDVMPTFAGETTGRARIVIQGAFPSCEALGLVRSPNNTLTNMTSTTNSDSAVTVGTFGTSNTSN